MEKIQKHLEICLRYLRIFMYVIIGVMVLYGGYAIFTTSSKLQYLIMTIIYIVLYVFCIKLIKKEEKNLRSQTKISIVTLFIIGVVGLTSGFIVLFVAIYTYFRAMQYNKYLKEGEKR